MKILATTNLEKTYGKEGEILFAGDWVKSNLNFDKSLKKRNYEFFESIWKNDEDVKKFYPYLNQLRNRVVEKLANNLNEIHNVDYPLRFWKIIVNPWLHYYLEGIYTRVETINKILAKKEMLNFIYLNNINNLDAPFDVRDFHHNITTSDIYNQFIFQKIINYFTKIKENKYLNLIYSNEKINQKESLEFLNVNEKQSYLRIFINFFIKKFSKKNNFFLELDSLSFLNFILLNFKLNQIPLKDYEFFNYKNYNDLFKNKSTSNHELRKKISFDFDTKNDYENFLNINFSKDVPKCLIEDFFVFQNFIKKIPYSPKMIVSDMKHEHDTIFKFWIANSVMSGTKLITNDHGGTYGGIYSHQIVHEDIADITIRWFKPISPNNIQLPALRLLNKTREKNKNNRKYLLTIGFEGNKYGKNIFSGPVSPGQILYQIDYLKKIYENLDLKLKDKFLFRPHPYNETGWNIKERIEHIFEKKKMILLEKNYRQYFKKSKIIVCTYPKTSFCEAMVSGPTILLINENYHKTRWGPSLNSNDFNLLHENMKEAKILFEDPILASKHLNKVWENVDEWWESKDVKASRKLFFKEVALVEPNVLEKWKNFLQKNI